VSKNTYLVLLVVVFMVFSALTGAGTTGESPQESVPLIIPPREKALNPAQADFFKRSAAAHQLWNNSLTLVEEFIKGLGITEKKNRSFDSAALEKLRENTLVILTLVKYFSITELDKFVELSNSSEIHSMVSKISKKAAQEAHLQHDIESLVYEIKTALRRAKKQLGKTTAEVLPIPHLEQLPILTDKGETIKKLIAARQLLTSCLPLIDELVRRQFNLEFKDSEGSKVSMAVRAVVESLTENPVVILILAQYFEDSELNKVAGFLDTIEVRTSVATVSRHLFVADGGQFQLDIERVRKEIEILSTDIRENLSDKLPQFFVEEKTSKGPESGTEEQTTSEMNPATKANSLEKLKALLPTEATKKDKVEGEGDKTGLESGKQEKTAKGKGDGKPEKLKGEKKPKKGKDAVKAGKTGSEKSTAPLPGKSIKKGKSKVEDGAKAGQEESQKKQE
jgi:hypothetical protein